MQGRVGKVKGDRKGGVQKEWVPLEHGIFFWRKNQNEYFTNL